MPWEYFTVILYSLYHSCEGIFFTFHTENLVRLLEGTSMKLWALVKLSSLHFLTCMLVHAYLPSIQQNYHLSVPTSLWLWWLFITLEAPVLQISGQQIILFSWWTQEKSLIFYLSEFFLNTRARHTTPSSLHVKAETSQFGDIKIRLVWSSH